MLKAYQEVWRKVGECHDWNTEETVGIIKQQPLIDRIHPSVMFHKILVVDDSPHIRRALRSSIEDRTEWVVFEAEHGKMAILMLGTHKPHIVLLDLSMPVMNGLEAAKEICKIAPDFPMIMFTMHQGREIVEAAMKAGLKHVFYKSDGFGDHVIDAIKMLLPPLQSESQAVS
jgi:DNA-binding NarL/FixJ family response regulator